MKEFRLVLKSSYFLKAKWLFYLLVDEDIWCIVQFPCHNLLVEAAWPRLFIGRDGAYWEVPSSMSVDLASVASDSGPSYHLSMHHNAGLPKLFEAEGSESSLVPASLLPGVAVKGAYAFKKNFDLWRSEGSMLKLVIPNDIFLLNPHISASGIIGMTCFFLLL